MTLAGSRAAEALAVGDLRAAARALSVIADAMPALPKGEP